MRHLKINNKINNLLLCLIILVNLYVILMPVVPTLLFVINSQSGRKQELSQKLHQKPATASKTAKPAANQPNSLIVPAMLLDQPVLEGRDTYAVLNKGILRLPASSTPDKGSNTVLIGHRFTYSLPKGVFYHLDKLKIGDEIGLIWNNKPYLYKVTETKVVPPTQTSIQAATNDARLTLFTCAPLLWPKDRLVVVAELISPTREAQTP